LVLELALLRLEAQQLCTVRLCLFAELSGLLAHLAVVISRALVAERKVEAGGIRKQLEETIEALHERLTREHRAWSHLGHQLSAQLH